MNNRTKFLADLDKRHFWHPFTQMKEWVEGDPLIIERGEGAKLYDTNGREYIDGVSSLWCNVHGHCRPEIDEAIRRQLGLIAHTTMLGLSGPPAIELAARLTKMAPGKLEKVFYSDSGSEAMEIALKMAFQSWKQRGDEKRDTYITLDNGYHGDTIGSVSLGGISLFHGVYGPLLFKAIHAPSPYCYRCPLGLEKKTCEMKCLSKMGDLLRENSSRVAAVVVEPLVQGAGGIIVHPRGYLAGVRELCNEYGVPLICDEVAVGFGRTGKMFACQHEGVEPDLMAVAKGLTGGYLPLAATLATNQIYEAFLGKHEEFKTFFHGHTYTGNALCCAAAHATLDIFEKENTIQKIQPRVEQISARLENFRALIHAGDVRQCGMIAAVELVKNAATKEDFAPAEKVGIRVTREARERGLITRPLGNVIVIMPPLCISESELDSMLGILYDSIKAVTENS